MKSFDRKYGTLDCFYIDDFYPLLGKKLKKQIEPKAYDKLIRAYFRVYFRDLYWNYTQPMYWPLSGFIRLTQQRWKGKPRIKWLLYKMPGRITSYRVRIKKVARGGRLIQGLENQLEERTDISLLPSRQSEWKKMKEDQILWIHANDAHTF